MSRNKMFILLGVRTGKIGIDEGANGDGGDTRHPFTEMSGRRRKPLSYRRAGVPIHIM